MHRPEDPSDDPTHVQPLPQDVHAQAMLETGARFGMRPRSRSADSQSTLPPGSRLGPYVIRGLLGQGGMGCVYLAEQLQPAQRDVALKLIRDPFASPLAHAYFDVERQALAQMQHPAIAQVFDAGTTADGLPYLAMEVVEGRPITDFCTENALDRSERLALFARVCRGVQHAHQKGIIHRDLKPGNVLVRRIDGEAMPKIIDFGIAVAGDAAQTHMCTGNIDRAGTVIYMSPEQAGHHYRDLDTRSDVYSLGVMLFELLTNADAAALSSFGHSARRDAHQTLLAAIDRHNDSENSTPAPDVLRNAVRGLPRELRAILRKALAADREDRYDSAAALADDLERYAGKRPVKALPATHLYRARTFIARHRLGIAAASLAVVAMLAGTVLALHGLSQARVEAARAAKVADFVQSILAGIDPDRAMGLDRKLMKLVLDSAAERAGRELVEDPNVYASIEYTIANSYASIGEFDTATTHYDTALAAARNSDMQIGKIARIGIRKARNFENDGDTKQALGAAKQVGDSIAALPVDNQARLFAESAIASIEGNAGDLAGARTKLTDILAAQQRTIGDAHPETLETMHSLAYVDAAMARYDEARPLYENIITNYRTLYGKENSSTLGAIGDLAILDLEQKHFADAEKLLAPMLPLYERLYGEDHPVTVRLVSNLGGAIRQQGRNEEARPYYERALEMSRKRTGPVSTNTVAMEVNLALLLRDAGQLDEAAQHARIAVKNAPAAFGDNPYRAVIFHEYATILTRQKQYAEAEKQLDHAWQILANDKGYGPQHPRSQDVVDSYIELYAAWDKPEREAVWRARKTTVNAVAGSRLGREFSATGCPCFRAG